jgi:general secretion pathway protein K
MRVVRTSESGFALLTVMVAIVLLSVLVVQFHFQSRVQLRIVQRQTQLDQTRLAAGSGVTLARRLLEEDSAEVDGPGDAWTLPLELAAEPLQWSISIEDDNGRLGLGGLFEHEPAELQRRIRELERLAAALGQPSSFVAALLDWLDEDDRPRPGGAENLFYLPLGMVCRNGPLDSILEVYRIRGATARRPQDRVRWEEYLSVRPGGEVNLNTAPLPVLMSLSERIDRALAERIAQRRARSVFRRVRDLREVPGVSQELYNEVFDRVSVASDRFWIRSRAELGETRTTVVAGVVREASSTRLEYWSLH